MPRSNRSKSGQTIVELLISISVLTVGFMGILNLLNQSLSMNRMVTDSYTGLNLSTEGLEIMKNMVDHNIILHQPWNQDLCPSASFEVDYATNDLTATGVKLAFPTSTTKLLYDTSAGFQYGTGSPVNFTRTVKTDCSNPDRIRVTSLVSWTTRGNAKFETEAEDYFFDWRPR
jgi:Tfp pilus assembly protein PilV